MEEMPKKRADLDEVRQRVLERRVKERLGSNAARKSEWQQEERTRETTDMLQQLADEVEYWRRRAGQDATLGYEL